MVTCDLGLYPDVLDYVPPTLSYIECYLDRIDQAIIGDPELVERLNTIIQPHIPTVQIKKVNAPIPIDASLVGWEGLDPVVKNRGGSRKVVLSYSVPTFDHFTD